MTWPFFPGNRHVTTLTQMHFVLERAHQEAKHMDDAGALLTVREGANAPLHESASDPALSFAHPRKENIRL